MCDEWTSNSTKRSRLPKSGRESNFKTSRCCTGTALPWDTVRLARLDAKSPCKAARAPDVVDATLLEGRTGRADCLKNF